MNPLRVFFGPVFGLGVALSSSGAAAEEVPVAVPSPDAQVVRLSEIEVTSTRTSALTQAPAESTLEALQPETVIDINTISNSIAPSADYTMVANFSPSVSSVQTNGPGLSEAKNILRGFSDGQYNVTFDGIPFGDTNSFTHHSTSYFPAKVIGRMVVDRGPGTASTVGEATFGGTLAIYSKDPREEAAVIPTFSYGSYNTTVSHLEGNTGRIDGLQGASLIASYQFLNSDGFRTKSYERRHTVYLKYLQPVGKNTEITVLTTYNQIVFGTPNSLTQAQIDQFGRRYGLVDDPANVLSRLYNYQSKRADLDYIGLRTVLGTDWTIENKIFTYFYNNGSHQNPAVGTSLSKTDIGGVYQLNRFRAWGDTLLVAREGDHGTFKAGAWYEYQRNPRYQYKIDYTRNRIIDYDPTAANAPAQLYNATNYNMVDWLKTVQPFLEYEWRPIANITLDGGVKYARFERDINAPVNQTTRTPLTYKKVYTKATPSVSANYRVQRDWSVYAQVAKGFLAPNLQVFYVPNPDKNNLSPQETMNYQVGTVLKTERLNADLDAYWIDYKNFPLTITDPVTKEPFYALASGAYYSGVEGEATYFIGYGLSLHANGSLNSAVYKRSKLDIPSVPDSTGLLGFVFNQGGFFVSLNDKYVGRSKIYSSGLNPDFASTLGARTESGGYWLADFVIGYSHSLRSHQFLKSYKVRVQVDNLLDRKVNVLSAISAKSVNSYDPLPGLNSFLTVSGEF